jgi:hypothetical protein
VLSEAMKLLGPVVLEPLVLLIEDRPELLQRKAALSVVSQLALPDVAGYLIERLEATRQAPRFAERAMLYLKLVSERGDIQKLVAARIAELVPSASSSEEKALLNAVAKAEKAAAG